MLRSSGMQRANTSHNRSMRTWVAEGALGHVGSEEGDCTTSALLQCRRLRYTGWSSAMVWTHAHTHTHTARVHMSQAQQPTVLRTHPYLRITHDLSADLFVSACGISPAGAASLRIVIHAWASRDNKCMPVWSAVNFMPPTWCKPKSASLIIQVPVASMVRKGCVEGVGLSCVSDESGGVSGNSSTFSAFTSR